MINDMPLTQTYSSGDDLLVNCSTSQGGPALTYQWLFNGQFLPDEVDPSLTRDAVNASDGGPYTCIVSNAAGNDSSSTTVHILPVITTQPQSIETTNNTEVILACEAVAFPEPKYLWMKTDGSVRPSLTVTSPMLIFEPVSFEDAGIYVCNVTSDNFTISSDTAILTGNVRYDLSCIIEAVVVGGFGNIYT